MGNKPAPGLAERHDPLAAAGALMIVTGHTVHAYASGGARPPACAWWPTGTAHRINACALREQGADLDPPRYASACRCQSTISRQA